MATQTPTLNQRSTTSGNVTLALSAAFMMSTLFAFALSVDGLYQGVFGEQNLPNGVRALGLVGIPAGLFGIPLAFAAAWDTPGRMRAWVGLILALVALAAFVTLLFAMG